MRAQIRYLIDEAGVSRIEMQHIACMSFKRAILPQNVRDEYLDKIRVCQNIYEIPMCDLHMHYVGSVPRAYLEKVYEKHTFMGKLAGTAQRNAHVPDVRRISKEGKCAKPWENLAAFAGETYSACYGVLLSEGLSAAAEQILAIAESCSSCGVVAITLQTGVPQGATAAWCNFFTQQLLIAQQRSLRLEPPCYVSFQADFIRNASVFAAPSVVSLMEMECKLGVFSEELTCPATVKKLKAVPVCGLRDHPARFPTTSDMYDILLIANNYVKDASAETKTQLEEMSAGLKGFSAEVKSASFLPEDSPFRVLADTSVFGSAETFDVANEKTMQVVERH